MPQAFKILLTKQQQTIVQNMAKIRILVACRRFGKSTTLAADILNSAATIKNGYSLVLNPFQDQSNKFFNQTFLRATNIQKCLAKEPKVHPYPKLIIKGTNHQVDMKTWESHSSQLGGYLNRAYLDESADFDSDQVFKTLQPKLADKRGLLFITGTVTTETSFIWNMFLRGQGSDPRFQSWRFTWKDAIVFQGPAGEAELQLAYDTMSLLDFQTQYEVLPVGDDSTAFPKLSRCIVDEEVPLGPQPNRRYSQVADVARTRDHTYVTVLDDTGLVVFEEEMQRGLDYRVYAKKCADIANHWRVGEAYTMDATGCGGSGGQRSTEDSIVKIYKQAYPSVKPFVWSGNSESRSKNQVVQFFACLTEEKRAHRDANGAITELPRLRIPRRFEKLIKQLQEFRSKVSATGALTFQGRYGHDDGASSLILNCWRAFKENALSDAPVQPGRWEIQTVKNL